MSFRQRPQYAGEIWKRSFISTVGPTVHTNPSRNRSFSENALQTGGIWKRNFISTVRPTVHSNPSWKRSFSKTLFKPEEFENASCSFSCGRKTFRSGAFRKWWRHDNHVISLTEFSSNTNPKWPAIVAVQCGRKTLMRFQSETSVFKFPRRRVDGA